MGMSGEPVGVVGLGKVGLCVALTLERAGRKVVGVEAAAARAQAIAARTLVSEEPQVSARLAEARGIEIAPDIATMVGAGCRLVLVVVATPSLEDGGYDHSQIDAIVAALVDLGPSKLPGDLVIVSTVMPGYCDQVAARLSSSNWRVTYNPAFIALGSVIANLESPEVFLVGASDREAALRVSALWRSAWRSEPRIQHLTRIEAELTKIAINSFLTLKVAFANAVGDLAMRMGGAPNAVLGAIGADSRVGSRCLGYGYGYGGPCLPRDNRALDRAARGHGDAFLIGRAADEANAAHLDFQVARALADPGETPVRIDHATYKPGTDSVEESQPLALALRLAREGRHVTVRDRASVIRLLQATYGDLLRYEVNEEA